jgi:hypothetical protein
MFYPNRIKIVTIYKNIFRNLDKLLHVFDKLKEVGAEAVIRHFGSGSGRQVNSENYHAAWFTSIGTGKFIM